MYLKCYCMFISLTNKFQYHVYVRNIFTHFLICIGTYNTALKAVKAVVEEEVARTKTETDYDQPRKRKKNRKYESSLENEEVDNLPRKKKYVLSSEDEEVDNLVSNVPPGTSSEVPAPDSLLPNKLKVLLKNKCVKTSSVCQQKDTSVGKLFSRNESRVKSSSSLKSTHNTMLDENPIQQHSLLNEGMYMYIHVS